MKNICLIMILVFFAGCGSVTVSPHLCKTQGIWSDDEQYNESYVTEDYFLGLDDQEILIKDIMERINIRCEQLKTIRIKIHTTFFIKRNIEIFYTLN